MAYTSATLSMTSEGPLTGAGNTWYYSTADATAVVRAANYISDAGSRGMKVGDLVIVNDTGTSNIYSHRVVTVSTTYPGAADLSDGTVIGTATNT